MHWLDVASDILKAQTGDLRQLAQLATNDITNFYEGQNLAGCDLRGQDLRGLNLANCNLGAALIDDRTKIDSIYDPRVQLHENYISFKISPAVEDAVIKFANIVGYRYIAWAYKHLFNRFRRRTQISQFEFYISIIKNNKYLRDICIKSDKDTYSETILVSHDTMKFLEQLSIKEPEFNCFNLSLVGAIISKDIRFNQLTGRFMDNIESIELDDFLKLSKFNSTGTE
ncbi:hypothetical protein [Sphingorhabdus contaminans]|uniref:hypothetical protein n=1 Tax=Sphingorhabdus contaminans TaxID=1343899 RepID=UPI003D26E603